MTYIRTYSELITLKTYGERITYLMLNGQPTLETFSHSRYLNQSFYKSKQWRDVRFKVIARDSGFDLGVINRYIYGDIYVHHMNPLTPYILTHEQHLALNPEYLISVSFRTHQHIHYGTGLPEEIFDVERYPGDTKLW